MEKISIIIPVFNMEKYLEECIRSVVGQTYKNIQIIIVDDGSKDNSSKICDKWAKLDNRIIVYHKANGGLSSARNIGLKLADGAYIAFVDSDDIIHPDFCIKMLSALHDNQSCDFVACGITKFIDPDISNNFTFFKYSSKLIDIKEYWHLILTHRSDNAVWGKLFRKQALVKQFRLGILNEDLIFFLDNTSNLKKIRFISECLYLYRVRSGSITNQISPRISDFINNSLEVKRLIGGNKNWNLEIESQGFLLTEITNVLSTIEKFDAREKYYSLYKEISDIVMKSPIDSFMNKHWTLAKKSKYIVVCYFPRLYRFLLKLKK